MPNETQKDIREELEELTEEVAAATTETEEEEQEEFSTDETATGSDESAATLADLVAIVDESVQPLKDDVETIMKSLSVGIKFQKSVKSDNDLVMTVLEQINDRLTALEQNSTRMVKSLGNRMITPPAPTSKKDDVRQRLAKSVPTNDVQEDDQLEVAEAVFVKSFVNNPDADAKLTIAVQSELDQGRIHPALKAEMGGA